MRQRLFIAVVFVGSGIVMAIMSLRDVFYHGVSSFSAVILMLACILMICGVLFKYRGELDEIEMILGKEERLLKEERELLEEDEEEIEKLKRKKGKEASGWRIRDMEYRLKKLEKKAE